MKLTGLVLTELPIDAIVAHLAREGVTTVEGPGERAGATEPILSVYFNDPDWPCTSRLAAAGLRDNGLTDPP